MEVLLLKRLKLLINRMEHFLFTSNSLSKKGYLKGLFQIILYRGSKNVDLTYSLLKNYFGVKREQLFLFSAGRMAVYSLLKSLNLKSEDEVIVAGYTCVVLTNAVKFANCSIKYVDIENTNFNMNLQKLENAISSDTKVIIVPHNFGIPFEGIKSIKNKYPEIIIVEDAAHCFGSKTKEGELCGTIGDVSFFSLEYSKPLTAGLGGIMLINNKALLPDFKKYYDELTYLKGKNVFRLICTLGVYNLTFSKRTAFFQVNGQRLLRLFKLVYRTSQKEIDGEIPENYPTKLNPKLACFLPHQLESIDAVIKKKQQIVSDYNRHFAHLINLNCQRSENEILVRYPLLFDKSITTETIQLLKEEGKKIGYQFGVWFNDVVHPSGSYRYGYKDGTCPVGEEIAPRIINLPVNVNFPLLERELLEIVALFEKHGVK